MPGAGGDGGVVLARSSRRVGADAEHRVVRCDPREFLERSCPVDRYVRAGAGLDFLQADAFAAAVA